MTFLKALGFGVIAYLGGILGLLLIPIIVVLCLWTGLCLLASVFLFAFWLLTHNAHTLAMACAMVAWGSPPCLAAFVLGYYGGQLRNHRNALKIGVGQDAPFR